MLDYNNRKYKDYEGKSDIFLQKKKRNYSKNKVHHCIFNGQFSEPWAIAITRSGKQSFFFMHFFFFL